ncbi:metal-dependent hydrolase [Tropicimonas sp. IMCC6043]|uniref:metal-dependent hydrolase n=1 Tax=Tropicimonas sp. IMCC6043 TaxID=2510645 RepID=UPI00101BCEE1|nr:metal-dependent hydrolase [Tropicimonas sp. IMCC6043]RYH11738.1 metal-dependent hydrolase [Tropicimonas sp. IMCC6043]
MKITWLGHSGFRIEIAGEILLVDPWFTGNPVFPADRQPEAIAGATHILLTHGHGDHSGDALAIAKELGVPLVGIYDLMSHWEATEGVSVIGFNKGGTVTLGDVAVTLVNATHSSSIGTDHGPMYVGGEAGFMIAGEGHVIYVSGDTDVLADMAIFAELHKPDIGILCAGGHFTMDMERAAFAARKFFDFKVVFPCHYKTFPLLAQSAQPLADALPGVDVKTPEVMETVEI